MIPDGKEKSDRKERFCTKFYGNKFSLKSGCTATSHIKNNPASLNHDTPILALTADVEAGNEKKCTEVGMIGMSVFIHPYNTTYNSTQ